MELYELLKEAVEYQRPADVNQAAIQNLLKLINEGANVNYHCESDNNKTPLHIASSGSFLPAVKLLIDYGANIDAQDSREQTPLMHASTYGWLSVVTYLVESNAGIDTQDKFGCTAFVRATLRGQLEIVKFLAERGANIHKRNYRFGASALLEASYWGHQSIVEYIVSKEADVEERDLDGRTSLYRACSMGHRGILQFLVENGADVNAQAKGKNSETPLHRAAFHGHLRIIEYLVQKGADINIRTTNNLTPAEVAHCNPKLSHEEKLKITEFFKRKDEDDIIKTLLPKLQRCESGANFDVDKEEFEQLLLKGVFESYDFVIYLSGPCNVGKTTLASLLIGKEIPDNWESTNSLDILFRKCCINLKENKIEPLSECKGNEVYNKLIRGQASVDIKKEVLYRRTSMDLQDLEIDAIEVRTSVDKNRELEKEPKAKVKLVSKSGVKHPPIQRLTSLEIQKDLLQKIRNGNYERDNAPCDIVDFGGQRAFDMTHQLFIHHRGLILLMFNGSKDLNDNLREYGDVSTMSILQHWIDSILAYCSEDSAKLPQIHFVATHSDMIKTSFRERRNELIRQIECAFKSHKKASHLFYENLFFINTTDVNDDEVARLKMKLVHYAKSNCEKLPMAWAPMLLQFEEMKKRGVGIVTTKEVETMNHENADLALSSKQLTTFLKYEHSVSRIVYFDEIGLDKFVTIQPLVLVDILRSFVTDERFVPEQFESIFNVLRQTGLIKRADLLKLWTGTVFEKEIITRECQDFVIDLLCKLDILINPSYCDADHFLVPCMVESSVSSTYFDSMISSYDRNEIICLSYSLWIPVVPPSLIFRLIGSIVSIWCVKRDDKNKTLLFCKSAVIAIDEYNNVLVRTEGGRILLHWLNKGLIPKDLVFRFQEYVTTALKRIISFYRGSASSCHLEQNYDKLFSIEIGVLCYDTPCLLEANKARTISSWTCSKDQKTKHPTDSPLYWTDTVENVCTDFCKGRLDPLRTPTIKDIMRFVLHFPINDFKKFFRHLPGNEGIIFENVEYNYQKFGDSTVMFMMLHKWERSRISVTYSDFLSALSRAKLDIHLLCHVTRHETRIYDISSKYLSKLQVVATDGILLKVAKLITVPYVFNLGIELGLNVTAIEEIIYRCSDLSETYYNVLIKWKQSIGRHYKPTILKLMEALQYVDFGAIKGLVNETLEKDFREIRY